MRPVSVDTFELRGLAEAVWSLAPRLECASAPVVAAAGSPSGHSAAGPVLASAVRRRALAAGRLRALAAVIAMAAQVYRGVEQDVAASFGVLAGASAGPSPWASSAQLLDLLSHSDPDRLEGLLVAVPALARSVVDVMAPSGGGPPGQPGQPGDATARDAAGVGVLVSAARSAPPGGRSLMLSAQRRVHDRLAALGAARVHLLALLHPALLTAVPSAPLEARCAASRVLVAADLDVQLRRLGAAPPGPARDAIGRQVAQRREWLHGSVTLRGPDGRARRQRHQLLAFDPRRDGQVVELLGDVDRAEHLAVFVPGTGSDLRRYPGTFARMVRFAEADPSVAVVVWQGADFPDQPFDDGSLPLREHVVGAAYRDAADVAGPRLAADVEGLRVAAPGAGADLTVLGHSYGGSIVGSAELHGMRPDRVVHVASAGAYLDPPVDGGVRRFSMTAYDDPIRLSQGHGAADATARWRAMAPAALDPLAPVIGLVAGHVDPAQLGHGPDPDLIDGVVRLDPGRFDDGRPVRGHSAMFEPGSTAWRNLLATMNGGQVRVLQPRLWASHLQPAGLEHDGSALRVRWPHYVVDRTPWTDPGYHGSALDLAPAVDAREGRRGCGPSASCPSG